MPRASRRPGWRRAPLYAGRGGATVVEDPAREEYMAEAEGCTGCGGRKALSGAEADSDDDDDAEEEDDDDDDDDDNDEG